MRTRSLSAGFKSVFTNQTALLASSASKDIAQSGKINFDEKSFNNKRH